MKLVKLRENTWINPEKVLCVSFDSVKLLTNIYLESDAQNPVSTTLPLEEVLKILAG